MKIALQAVGASSMIFVGLFFSIADHHGPNRGAGQLTLIRLSKNWDFSPVVNREQCAKVKLVET